MLVYIDDREDEEFDDCENENSDNSYGYDYGYDEEPQYDYLEGDAHSYFD